MPLVEKSTILDSKPNMAIIAMASHEPGKSFLNVSQRKTPAPA